MYSNYPNQHSIDYIIYSIKDAHRKVDARGYLDGIIHITILWCFDHHRMKKAFITCFSMRVGDLTLLGIILCRLCGCDYRLIADLGRGCSSLCFYGGWGLLMPRFQTWKFRIRLLDKKLRKSYSRNLWVAWIREGRWGFLEGFVGRRCLQCQKEWILRINWLFYG